MEVRSVGNKLFHSDGWTDANSRFSQFCERASSVFMEVCPGNNGG